MSEEADEFLGFLDEVDINHLNIAHAVANSVGCHYADLALAEVRQLAMRLLENLFQLVFVPHPLCIFDVAADE